MLPVSLRANSPEEIDQKLEELQLSGYLATLAIVFIGDRVLTQGALLPFQRHGIAVFGSCSAEEISQGRISNSSIVALLFDLPPSAFLLKFFENPLQRQGEILGRAIGETMKNTFEKSAAFLLIGGGGLAFNTEDVLRGIFEILPGAPVFGGVPSSFGVFDLPPFFDSSSIRTDGIYSLILDRNVVEVQGVAISGWQELGTAKRITRSSGNKVFEIEGVPATIFYANYFNINTSKNSALLNNIDPELLAASEYPILLRREDGSEVMRAAIRMDATEQAVYYGGDIPEGSLVRFCSPNVLETIQHTVDGLQTFRTNARDVDAVLLFNCAIRSRALGPYMVRELELIDRLWAAPSVGFSSWGEIGKTPGQSCGFHNTVISMVTLRDQQSKTQSQPREDMTAGEIEALVEGESIQQTTIENLRQELNQVRREKRILSHFLRLTSGDLEREQKKSEELLLNILPSTVAERLKHGETVIADRVETASILFSDLVGFTTLSAGLSADRLVVILNDLFSRFDDLTEFYGVEKIKTIGDAYMAVAGLPTPVFDHADRCVSLARAMLDALCEVNKVQNLNLKLRIGINSGPVVAGVIGKRKFSYDLWGDAVNTAQRMESHGEPGRIQISAETYALLKQRDCFLRRDELDIKGKGRVTAYLSNL